MLEVSDLDQKLIYVILFTGALLVLWWYIRKATSGSRSSMTGDKLRHIESRQLAHSTVLSIFKVNSRSILVLQTKNNSHFLDVTKAANVERLSVHS